MSEFLRKAGTVVVRKHEANRRDAARPVRSFDVFPLIRNCFEKRKKSKAT